MKEKDLEANKDATQTLIKVTNKDIKMKAYLLVKIENQKPTLKSRFLNYKDHLNTNNQKTNQMLNMKTSSTALCLDHNCLCRINKPPNKNSSHVFNHLGYCYNITMPDKV